MCGVSLDRVEPVLDAQLDGVRGRRADAGLDLVAELVEVVFRFGLGLAADAGTVARLAVAVVAERKLADVAPVGLVPGCGSVAAVAATILRLGRWGFVGHRASLLSGLACSFLQLELKTSLDVPKSGPQDVTPDHCGSLWMTQDHMTY